MSANEKPNLTRIDRTQYSGRTPDTNLGIASGVRGSAGVTFSMSQRLKALLHSQDLQSEKIQIINRVPYFNKLDGGPPNPAPISQQAPQGIFRDPEKKAHMQAIMRGDLASVTRDLKMGYSLNQDTLKSILLGAAAEVLNYLQSPWVTPVADRDDLHAIDNYDIRE